MKALNIEKVSLTSNLPSAFPVCHPRSAPARETKGSGIPRFVRRCPGGQRLMDSQVSHCLWALGGVLLIAGCGLPWHGPQMELGVPVPTPGQSSPEKRVGLCYMLCPALSRDSRTPLNREGNQGREETASVHEHISEVSKNASGPGPIPGLRPHSRLV